MWHILLQILIYVWLVCMAALLGAIGLMLSEFKNNDN